MITTSLHKVASAFLGIHEVDGAVANPLILAMLQLDAKWPEDDAVPWCSGAMNFWCHIVGVKRSHSLAARSWLGVGQPIKLIEARAEDDIVILERGEKGGHVGLFDHVEGENVYLLAGNQSNKVSISPFSITRVLGVRRLV